MSNALSKPRQRSDIRSIGALRSNLPDRALPVASLEPLEVRNLLSALASIAIFDSNLPAIVVPGDKVTLKVAIFSVGTDKISENLNLKFSAEAAGNLGVFGEQAVSVKLRPGRTLVVPLIVRFKVGSSAADNVNLRPGNLALTLVATPAAMDSSLSIAPVNLTRQLQWSCGQVGARRDVRMTFVDDVTAEKPKLKSTFSLTGPGVGTLVPQVSGPPNLSVTGTKLGSTLRITGPESGTLKLRNINIDNPDDENDRTSLGRLLAGRTDLTGNFTATGAVGRVELRNIEPETGTAAQRTFIINPVKKSQAVVLKFGSVKDLTVNCGDNGVIQNFRVSSWIDSTDPQDDRITAYRLRRWSFGETNPAEAPIVSLNMLR